MQPAVVDCKDLLTDDSQGGEEMPDYTFGMDLNPLKVEMVKALRAAYSIDLTTAHRIVTPLYEEMISQAREADFDPAQVNIQINQAETFARAQSLAFALLGKVNELISRNNDLTDEIEALKRSDPELDLRYEQAEYDRKVLEVLLDRSRHAETYWRYRP